MKIVVNGQYGQYAIYEKCIAVGGHFFNSVSEIEKFRYFRLLSGFKSLDNILDEAIKIINEYVVEA
jgi:hypothetical protein